MGFANHTVRQVVRVSAGGALARIRLSNAFGTRPLTVTGATIARSACGAALRPNSLWHLTFRGSRSVNVRPGHELASDPAPLRVAPLDTLTVTLYLAKPTGPATQHLMAGATTYRANGDHRADVGAGAFTETTRSWYYLAGVDVLGAPPRRDVVATFGDSITDGAASTVDGDNHYPDELAELLRGLRGVDEPRVGTVVVLEGVNDIGASVLPPDPCVGDAPVVTAADLIAGHRDLIRQARARGLTVIGATMLPFKAASYYYTEEGEAVRDAVNQWMRTSGEYDAVAVADVLD